MYGKIGKDNPNYGTKRTPEQREKLKGRCGPLSAAWKGGIAADPYCDVWLDWEYKQSIKDRDNNKCQNPDCWGKCNHLPLHLHHINNDKKDCRPKNIITLCNSCNGRARGSKEFSREWWVKFYQNIMTKKYEYEFVQKARGFLREISSL